MGNIELPKIPDFRNGIRTTEFYVTLLSYVLSMLVMFGVMNSDEAQQFLDNIGGLVAAVIALGTALGPVVTTVVYIYSRIKAKEDATASVLEAYRIQKEQK